MVLLVTGFAWARGQGEDGDKMVTVQYWHTMSDPETKQLQNVIGDFETANPGIRIEPTQYAWDDYRTAILTGVAGGQLPDTARLDIIWVPEFADKGWLMQLDGRMPDFEAIIEDTFPGPRATALWNGHYYGLPQNTNTQLLLWNRDIFEAAGIESPPKTVKEFVAVAERLSDPANEHYGFAMGGTYFWAPAPIFYSMGGRIVDEDITTAQGYINGPESVAAFKTLTKMYQDGALSPNLLGGGIGTSDGHATGRYAMIIDGPWMVDIYKDNYPDFDVAFALVPAGPDGTTSSVVGGEDVVLFDGTRHPDAAMTWAKYLLSPEAQLKMAEVGVMPTLKSLRGHEALPDYFDIFMEQLETARARVPHPTWSEMDGAINNAFQRMLRGDQTVQTSLDQAASEIDALLSK